MQKRKLFDITICTIGADVDKEIREILSCIGVNADIEHDKFGTKSLTRYVYRDSDRIAFDVLMNTLKALYKKDYFIGTNRKTLTIVVMDI